MNFKRIVLVALVGCVPLQAVSEATFLQRQYKQVKNDLKIVQKCYLSDLKCTSQERVQARNAALRLTGEALALIAAISGLIYSGYNLYSKYGKQKASDKLLGFDDLISLEAKKLGIAIDQDLIAGVHLLDRDFTKENLEGFLKKDEPALAMLKNGSEAKKHAQDNLNRYKIAIALKEYREKNNIVLPTKKSGDDKKDQPKNEQDNDSAPDVMGNDEDENFVIAKLEELGAPRNEHRFGGVKREDVDKVLSYTRGADNLHQMLAQKEQELNVLKQELSQYTGPGLARERHYSGWSDKVNNIDFLKAAMALRAKNKN